MILILEFWDSGRIWRRAVSMLGHHRGHVNFGIRAVSMPGHHRGGGEFWDFGILGFMMSSEVRNLDAEILRFSCQ